MIARIKTLGIYKGLVNECHAEELLKILLRLPHLREMWTAIERLQQGESLNVQDVKTNLFWEFGKFTSRDGESMESYYSRHVQFLQQLQPEWSRFVTVVKQRQEIDTVSYHKLFDVLKQFQNEVNDIRSERLARSANSISTCVAASQRPNHITTIRHQKTFKDRSAPSYMQSLTPRPNALPRHKAKEIVKPVTPSI
ncbi:hypothetical protein Tco_0013082 [Tanacetum coccineum]